MTDANPLLGRLLSTHRLDDYRWKDFIGCGVFLLMPLGCGITGLVVSLTGDAEAGGNIGDFVVAIVVSVALIGFFGLVFFLSPRWRKGGRLEIYENGLVVKRILFEPQTFLWREIREVIPFVRSFRGYRMDVPPAGFAGSVADTKVSGYYEIFKKNGDKFTVGRRYVEIERLDERLIPFCPETPVWEKAEEAN